MCHEDVKYMDRWIDGWMEWREEGGSLNITISVSGKFQYPDFKDGKTESKRVGMTWFRA